MGKDAALRKEGKVRLEVKRADGKTSDSIRGWKNRPEQLLGVVEYGHRTGTQPKGQGR